MQLRKILFWLGMELAALLGAPLRPEEIEALFRKSAEVKVEAGIGKDREDPA